MSINQSRNKTMEHNTAAAVAVPGDLVEEILLRFPPHDPASLIRAALVADAGFRRRLREFHLAPPMLGVIWNVMDYDPHTYDRAIASFIPTTSSSALRRRRFILSPAALYPRPPSPIGWLALDSRHGRVLLHTAPFGTAHKRMVMWDPMTDDQMALPVLPPEPYAYHTGWNAAVICATGNNGRCDRFGCHRSPFLVVFVGSMRDRSRACARVYSSETAAWSEMITSKISNGHLVKRPGVLSGNALYFRSSSRMILKFGLVTRKISEIQLPYTVCPHNLVLTTTVDGGLGFAEAVGSRLYMWSREAGLDHECAGWTQSWVIELEGLHPTWALSSSPWVLAFAGEGADLIFLWINDGVFSINTKSHRVAKLDKVLTKNSSLISMENIVPYVSFYARTLHI